jgi:hypothetical protein
MFQQNLTGAGIFIIENYDSNIVATLFGNYGIDYSEPGGKIDIGETPEEAACRETREETANLIRIRPHNLHNAKTVIVNNYIAYIMYLKDVNFQLFRHNVNKIFRDCISSHWKETTSVTRVSLKSLIEIAIRNTNYMSDINGAIIKVNNRTLGIVRKSIQLLNNITYTAYPLKLHANVVVASRMPCLIGTYSCTLSQIPYPSQILSIHDMPNNIMSKNKFKTSYKYGVYIVPKLKPENEKLHECMGKFGGLHISLLDFSFHHIDLNKNIKKLSNAGINKWKINVNNFDIKNNILYFKSSNLDKIAKYLHDAGFQKIKGKFFGGEDWNISFGECNIPANIQEIFKRVSWSFIIIKYDNNNYEWVNKYKVHRVL